MIPGEYRLQKTPIVCNEDKPSITLSVVNRGDRPVQVGSHFHFFEVNDALEFTRGASYGMHLDIPAGTAVRFEPGDAKDIQLVPFSGERRVYGLHNKVEGPLDRGAEK